MSKREDKVSLRSILLALLLVIAISSSGLTLYFLFKDSDPVIAMGGLILVFGSAVSLLILPQFVIKLLLERKNLKERKQPDACEIMKN